MEKIAVAFAVGIGCILLFALAREVVPAAKSVNQQACERALHEKSQSGEGTISESAVK